MKAFSFVLLSCVLLAGCGTDVDVQRLQDCSVRVTDGQGWGSGVFVAPNIIVTAAHVAECDPTYIELNDGTTADIVEIFISDKYDVAFVRVDLVHDYLPLGEAVKLGDVVYHVGTPLDAAWFNCLFQGIVSKTDIDWAIWTDGIVVDAFGAHGCSGGGVFNEKGQVVGIMVGGMVYGCGICEPVSHIQEALNVYLEEFSSATP